MPLKKIRRYNKNQAVNLQTKKLKVRQRIAIFLVVLLLIFSDAVFSQQGTIFSKTDTLYRVNPVLKINILSKDFYSRNLGILCRQELLLEKKTAIPFRIRLGSLEYVNQMEGKTKNQFPF